MSYEEERKIKLNEAYWGAADSGDFERFSAFFAEDSKMTFANDPPLSGKEVLRKFYAEFFQVIEKMKHKPIHSHSFPFGVVTELTVQYWVKNDPEVVELPIVTIARIDDGKSTFNTLSIYYDPSPLKDKIHKYFCKIA
eukprot:TRINITY_DN2909_c0_g1_i1.p1 TRINITY_DN2909_c0_g1~~TRINITY_DN2909_c0_g1_i1.p1  ORF type:complete len:138 (-),score=46.00 TRINITY_DN2909_c0_g1_i1:32-445(-)